MQRPSLWPLPNRCTATRARRCRLRSRPGMPWSASASMQTQLLREPRVAPSILSADFAHLADQVQAVLDAGARVIHCDVMDGHFVPPITLGPAVVGSLSAQVHDAGGILDVHLMIERPERQLHAFAGAGADVITI